MHLHILSTDIHDIFYAVVIIIIIYAISALCSITVEHSRCSRPKRSRVRISAGPLPGNSLGKLLAALCLCHQAV